jgi:hypothetical protein
MFWNNVSHLLHQNLGDLTMPPSVIFDTKRAQQTTSFCMIGGLAVERFCRLLPTTIFIQGTIIGSSR